MKIRFQADANLDPDIARGIRRREPLVDFQDAGHVIPDGAPDPDVLLISATAGRVLVTADIRTMNTYFDAFIEWHESPGVILVPSSRSIGGVIEGLLFVWVRWTADDLRNQIFWLP